MARKNEYYHLLLHVTLFLGELQRRLEQLHESPTLDKEYTKLQITQLSKDTIKLLQALEPCLPYAIKHMPKWKDFYVSCQESITKIKKDLSIDGPSCECDGCLPPTKS